MPVVRIIAGDDDMGTAQALEALHRHHNEDPVWEVKAARVDGDTYHIAVSGAAARLLGIPVVMPFHDPGIHRDQCAAAGVALTVDLPDVGTPGTENTVSRVASQPAASDTHGEPSVEATPETHTASLLSGEDETPHHALPLLSSRTQRKDASELYELMRN